MNRKRRNADVIAQLGEPLPLPYRPSTQTIKTEEEESETEIVSDTFRPRQTLRFKDRDVARLPIWHSGVDKETLVVHSIEQKLASLKLETLTDTEIEKLEEIDNQIGALLEQRHETSLLQELEKLQHTEPAAESTTSSISSSKWTLKIFLVSLALIFVGVSSFIAGNHSYEYCYYFC